MAYFCTTTIQLFKKKYFGTNAEPFEADGMRPIKRSEIIPQKAKFSLSATGKEYAVRPFNLEDEEWLDAEFGAELELIFAEVRVRNIVRIAYHQLEECDRSQLGVQTITITDEDGNEQRRTIGGAKLLMTLISGAQELNGIIRALVSARGISQPIMDELISDVQKADSEKKSQSKQTGAKSSTPLRANTDGRSKRSGN